MSRTNRHRLEYSNVSYRPLPAIAGRISLCRSCFPGWRKNTSRRAQSLNRSCTHQGLYGAFFVKGVSRQSGRPLHSILLFDPRREHSSVPTAYFHRRRGAAAVKDGACMGFSLSRGCHANLVVLCIPFFCSTCAASILSSRPHICIAVAHSGGQGRRFFSAAEGLSLTDASTAAGC